MNSLKKIKVSVIAAFAAFCGITAANAQTTYNITHNLADFADVCNISSLPTTAAAGDSIPLTVDCGDSSTHLAVYWYSGNETTTIDREGTDYGFRMPHDDLRLKGGLYYKVNIEANSGKPIEFSSYNEEGWGHDGYAEAGLKVELTVLVCKDVTATYSYTDGNGTTHTDTLDLPNANESGYCYPKFTMPAAPVNININYIKELHFLKDFSDDEQDEFNFEAYVTPKVYPDQESLEKRSNERDNAFAQAGEFVLLEVYVQDTTQALKGTYSYTIDGEQKVIALDFKDFVAKEDCFYTEAYFTMPEADVKYQVYRADTNSHYAITQKTFANVDIHASGRSIVVNNVAKGNLVTLFNMQGQVLSSAKISGNSLAINVPRAGSYIVRIGNQTRQINVE